MSSIKRLSPRLVVCYVALLLLCGLGYARYSSYVLDGDAVAFMDLSDSFHAHHFAGLINGYWNPAYAVALALGATLAHPSRWQELQTFYWVNFVIFAASLLACVFFVRGLDLLRRHALTSESDDAFALPLPLLLLASLALLFASFQRELLLSAVRSDSLLLFFFLIAAGLVVRLQAGGRAFLYPLLGLTLGLAYLTKSFAFLPSVLLLLAAVAFALTRPAPRRGRLVARVLLALFLFVTVAGPYIAAISKQRGRFTTGESARLNYAFFIDLTGRWHEWHSGDMGHATATWKHHETLLLDQPAVYSYAQHPLGTYPLWFDPAFWTDTVQPHVWLPGQFHRLVRNVALLTRFLLGHLEVFVVVAVLLGLGALVRPPGRSLRTLLPLLVLPAWGLLMFGIYFPVDFQDRYLTGPLLLIVLPLLALLRRSQNDPTHLVGSATALLLAGLVLVTGFADVAARRRALLAAHQVSGAWSPEIFPAAHGLNQLGIGNGAPVACFGDQACYVDQYWARLAQTPIRAEIEVPHNGDPAAFWQSLPDQQALRNTLRQQGISAIVAVFSPAGAPPAGWQRLDSSDFFAYPLR